MILTEWLRRVWYLINRQKLERELQREMAAHREMMGQPRRFGNTLRLREEARDVWGWNWLDDIGRDLRHAFKGLRRSPGFFIGALAILSLGIGVNLAAFQFIDTYFWKPFDVRDPHSLVQLYWNERGWSVPYPAIQFVGSNNNVLSAVMVRADSRAVGGVTWDNAVLRGAEAAFVSANWFGEFSYQTIKGRVFREGIDDAPEAEPGVVMSETFWEKRLNRDPDIVGKTVRVNDRPAVVLGVVAHKTLPRQEANLWMPVAQIDYFIPGNVFKTSSDLRLSPAEFYARLRPGVSLEAARASLRPVAAELAIRQPGGFRRGDWLEPYSASMRFEPPNRRHEAWLITAQALGLTLLILVVACANLINLILSRTVGRMRDLTIRTAIGASPWRVMRHLLAESTLLALVGSLVGLLLVYWASQIFFALVDVFPRFTIDWRTVLAGLFSAAVAVAAIGLLPAWKISRSDLTTAIKDGGAQASASLGRTRWKHALLAAQLACSCILLVLAGLMFNSLRRVVTNQGFEYENVAMLTASLERQGINSADAALYWSAVRDAVSSQPETEAVALVSRPPLANGAFASRSESPGLEVAYYEVGAGFFEVMRIPIAAGRALDASDEFTASAVISRRLAMAAYGSLDVIGRGYPRETPTRTIVGVAADVTMTNSESPAGGDLYVPLNPKQSNRTLIVRARTNASRLVAVMMEATRAHDERIVANAQLLSRNFAQGFGERRAMSGVLSVLASLALTLTCVGVFGVISYSTTLRRKEIGIRMSLGAGRRSIILTLIRQLKWPLALGIVFGLTAGVLLGGLFSGVPLFVQPFDIPVLTIAALLLLVTAGLAAVLPAVRALRMDVLQSLRFE